MEDRFLKCKQKTARDGEYVDAYLMVRSQIKAAEICGVSRETIARAVRRAGITMTGRRFNGNPSAGKNQPNQKISNEQLAEEAKSLTCKEIAIKYGMSEERVWKRAKRLGVDLETRWGGGHHERRAARYGVPYEKGISLAEVIKRGNGICKICGKPVDLNDIVDGHARSRYPSIDHIIPLSKGGSHTWENIQLAHLGCNSRKQDNVYDGNTRYKRKEV